MPATLFFALAAVYLVGLVGIVVVGSFVGSPEDDAPVGLEERLAVVRATEPVPRKRAAPTTTPYFVRAVRRR